MYSKSHLIQVAWYKNTKMINLIDLCCPGILDSSFKKLVYWFPDVHLLWCWQGFFFSVPEPIPFENRACIDFSDAGPRSSALYFLLSGTLSASHEAAYWWIVLAILNKHWSTCIAPGSFVTTTSVRAWQITCPSSRCKGSDSLKKSWFKWQVSRCKVIQLYPQNESVFLTSCLLFPSQIVCGVSLIYFG